ncbi:hypothetical protein E2C01_083082 [Portunus trituberculatus]|uniref:Uncharacterized protein n=1 Tax=Portunus trituberculatus TaxID=210409 RepID=A0A5B7J071_PORTR|nr:hypothetical protein [Portunus trituberculatus]
MTVKCERVGTPRGTRRRQRRRRRRRRRSGKDATGAFVAAPGRRG